MAGLRTFLGKRAQPVPVGKLQGAEAIGQAVAGMMPPHSRVVEWSNDPRPDRFKCMATPATIETQFIVYITVGDEKPAWGMCTGR
jgi:hypothetical protein